MDILAWGFQQTHTGQSKGEGPALYTLHMTGLGGRQSQQNLTSKWINEGN